MDANAISTLYLRFFVRFIFPENKGRFVEFSFLRNEEKRIYVKKN